ncbi:MAG TPA: hypothetical protein VFK07_03380, partial [Candidatus Paceibacterota bacterium]|nr:hypothetical protein [Candidatus Paceibacterota bacterium]
MISKIKEKAKNWLIWSQRYTRTDMLYLAKGGFWLSGGQILGTLSSFLLALAFANLVDKNIYGTYKYIISLASGLGALTLTGMNTAVTRAVASGAEGTLKKSVIYQLKWNIILFAAAIGVGFYYWLHGNNVIAIAMILVGILSPFINTTNTYMAYLNGKKDFRRMAFYGAAINILVTIVLVVTMIINKNVLWLVF